MRTFSLPLGIEATLEKMTTADPHFILGKVVTRLLQLIGTGTSGRKEPEILSELKELRKSVAVSLLIDCFA